MDPWRGPQRVGQAHGRGSVGDRHLRSAAATSPERKKTGTMPKDNSLRLYNQRGNARRNAGKKLCAGSIDMTAAIHSPGSTLKPFIYALGRCPPTCDRT